MEQPTKKFRPYLSWKTFLGVLDHMQEFGLPARIDRSYLKGRSGVDQTYIMATLKSFGLIGSEGEVLPPLRGLVQNRDDRPAAIRGILEQNYAEALALPNNATQAQLGEAFRDYGLSGATARKAETFFLHAAAYAGIKLSSHFKSPRVTGTPASRRPSRPRPRTDRSTPPVPHAKDTPAGNGVQVTVHPMLQGAITWLSEHGEDWNDSQADTWIDTFGKNVRLVYPPKPPLTVVARDRRPRPVELHAEEDAGTASQ